MANGSDGNENKEISCVRPGLKREFAFALKSKAEYGSSTGRTRTRRSRHEISGNGEYEVNIEDEEPKLELEGSEKTTLKKIPTKLKELLETGLLEGISVRYQYGAKRKGKKGDGLKGIVSATGIICFCLKCNGVKVVSPNMFECHAGSKNKRSAEYIYLENGRSLHDLLNACKMAPLEALESLIQSMIGCTTSTEQNVFCRNCKSSITGGSGEERLVCGSCKESQCNPAASVEKRNWPRNTLSSKTPNSNFACSSRQEGKLTRKDLGFHKLMFEKDVLADGTALAYCAHEQICMQGQKRGLGILCFCCKNEVSPSRFEAHAGCASRRQPYQHIYTSNGVSLHALALRLSKLRNLTEGKSDDLCSKCATGGDLLCCDNCPRAFHTACVSLPCLPTGTWHGKRCQSMIERQKFVETNANAKVAGRIIGTDPLEDIAKRCIQISEAFEADRGGCVLCRGHDFSPSGFSPQTIMICDQCEKEYHVRCLKEHEMDDLKELPVGKWFCCKDCSRIHSALEERVAIGNNFLPEYSLLNIVETNDLYFSWRLLSGRNASNEDRKLLSKAVSIFHDQFDPVLISSSGVGDLIPHMVLGRNVEDYDFGGMYCAILKVKSIIVSAGIIRIFGKEIAELPLIATSIEKQGQGYFRMLFACLENLLLSLNVKKLVLPAANEAVSLWTTKFGFSKIKNEELMNYHKDYQMMVFQRTMMLQKSIGSS